MFSNTRILALVDEINKYISSVTFSRYKLLWSVSYPLELWYVKEFESGFCPTSDITKDGQVVK